MDRAELLREWKRESKKCERAIQHLHFLKDCMHFNMIPKCLKIKNKWLNKEFQKEVRKCEKIVLRKMIKRKYMLTEKLKHKIETNKEKCRDLFGKVEVEKDQKRIDGFTHGEAQEKT